MTLTPRDITAIRQVRSFIDSVPLRRIPIAELMQIFGLSEDKLTKGFKELYGERLYNYQLRVAIDHAKELLTKGNNIKAIAKEMGYSSPGSFSRAFFRVSGKRPTQYLAENLPQ